MTNRPTGVFKRAPEMTNNLRSRYARISKADWSDLYFDAVRQLYGETMTDEEIMQDAEKRLEILKNYRSK
jgi:hypothetical protein